MSAQSCDWVGELVGIMRRLRGEDGCPWDREQTHESLKRYLVEETHEFFDAVDVGDHAHMSEELGDILLQIVFHCQIGAESGLFDLQDAARLCCEKMIRRHPHVFAESHVEDAAGVVKQWEAIKKVEKGGAAEKSVLDGIARSLPALSRAEKIQARAARVGFDWPEVTGVLDKLSEEVAELRDAVGNQDVRAIGDELGDVLFSIVNLSRFLGQDAEECLRRTNGKFTRRFQFVEERLRAQGQEITQVGLEAMEVLWNEAKRQERCR